VFAAAPRWNLSLLPYDIRLTVLRRRRPGRLQLSSLDRPLWVWLYRIWPQVIDAMVLVKPATVVQWHRNGFRLYWRWQSRRLGRPKIGTEIGQLQAKAGIVPVMVKNCDQHLEEEEETFLLSFAAEVKAFLEPIMNEGWSADLPTAKTT
jgi:hypothetical protein